VDHRVPDQRPDGKTVAFLSDVEYPSIDDPLPEALALAHEADLLIHDCDARRSTIYDIAKRVGATHQRVPEWSFAEALRGAKKLAFVSITVPMRPTI